MARTKIDILTPIGGAKDFNTTEVYIPATLMVVWNGQVLNTASDFMEYGTSDGFKLNFTLPSNVSAVNDNLIAIYSLQDQTGLTVQETIRKINEETRFQMIARTGLLNVKITIYNNTGNIKLVDNVVMTEKDSQGVYEYNFTPTAVGTYTAIMRDETDFNMQVTEIIIVDGDLQDIFDKVCEIRNTQVLGKPKIILGDPC